jgi:hypothetical protein
MWFRTSPPANCPACNAEMHGKFTCGVCGLSVRPPKNPPRSPGPGTAKHGWRRWIIVGGTAGFLFPLFLRFEGGETPAESGEFRFARLAGPRSSPALSPRAYQVQCPEPLCKGRPGTPSPGVQSCPACGSASTLLLKTETGWLEPAPDLLRGFLPSGAATLARGRTEDNALVSLWFQTFRRLRVAPSGALVQFPESTWRTKTGDERDHAIFLADVLLTQGYNVRVVIGEFRGRPHSWVVVDYNGHEYLLDLLGNRPALFPPRVSAIGADYRAELAFDREACYFPTYPGGLTNRYFEPGLWRQALAPSTP